VDARARIGLVRRRAAAPPSAPSRSRQRTFREKRSL